MNQPLVRKWIKNASRRVGMDTLLRDGCVQFTLMGERLVFGFRGHPVATSAIVLAGSGRSGTTWITNVLTALPGIQQIFEPLIPLWNAEVRQLTGWGDQDPYFRAHYLRALERNDDWRDLLERVLTGRVRNYWTDYERTAWFPGRFLVKEVRANLMLGFIYEQFQPSIIYLMRHPCAVIHSRLTAPTPWHADAQDILRQEQLVEDYLRPWVREIERERDLLGAHAVWWAVENMVALQELSTRRHLRVHYEHAVLEPMHVASEMIRWLGESEPSVQRLISRIQRNSRMSNRNVQYSSSRDRLTHWQRQLSKDEQTRILGWAHRLGVDIYGQNAMPRTSSDQTTSCR